MGKLNKAFFISLMFNLLQAGAIAYLSLKLNENFFSYSNMGQAYRNGCNLGNMSHAIEIGAVTCDQSSLMYETYLKRSFNE
jgi:hypothetical protein